MQQQTATVVRDTAAVDHAIHTLDGKLQMKKQEFEMMKCARQTSAALAGTPF